jgi:predicted  nucleic acid-binding Zn-ribbon protein
LELIWELQKIDLDLKTIKADRDRHPKEMKRLEEREKIEREKIQKEKEKVESLEKERRQKEGLLNTEMDKVKRTKERMFEVKTNKEYQAILNELEAIEEASGRGEEEVLRLMEEIDESKKNLAKREKEVAINLEKIEGERRGIQEKIARGDAAWKKQMERREALSKQIESSLCKLYDTLKERRQGLSVVTVKQGTCQGCFVNSPPQMFIEVQKTNTIVRCPHCSRILYWEGNGKTT